VNYQGDAWKYVPKGTRAKSASPSSPTGQGQVRTNSSRAHGGPPMTNPAASRAIVGIGLKPRYVPEILGSGVALDFFGVHAENDMVPCGHDPRHLEQIRADFALSIHGVGLSIGGAGPIATRHLDCLVALLGRFGPQGCSEHLAWSSHGRRPAGPRPAPAARAFDLERLGRGGALRRLPQQHRRIPGRRPGGYLSRHQRAGGGRPIRRHGALLRRRRAATLPFEVGIPGNRLGAVLADQVKSLDWVARKAQRKGKVSTA